MKTFEQGWCGDGSMTDTLPPYFFLTYTCYKIGQRQKGFSTVAGQTLEREHLLPVSHVL